MARGAGALTNRKTTLTPEDRQILSMGRKTLGEIARENIERMKAGKPVVFPCEVRVVEAPVVVEPRHPDVQ